MSGERSDAIAPWRALVLAIAVLVLAATVRHWPTSAEPTAHAGVAITGDRVAMLTADGGSDEICAVLDDTTETIQLYRVGNPGGVELIGSAHLPTLFNQARAGRPPRR